MAFDFPNAQRLGITLAYTYLDELTLQPRTDLPPENNKGQLDGDGPPGCGLRAPSQPGLQLRHRRAFSANWRINYLSSIQDTLDENGPSVLDPSENDIDAFAYHDFQFRYGFGSRQSSTTLPSVSHNAFDKKPPPLINQNGAVEHHRHGNCSGHVRSIRSHVVRGR